jgi:AcrR family transcriptional regulator
MARDETTVRRRTRPRVRPTREQTKATLIKAARRVFAERGYGHATVDEIAEAAGLTKGAVYSNFGGKAELFYALMRERIEERLDLAAEAAGTLRGNVDQIAVGVGGVLKELMMSQREWQIMYVEFWAVAAHDQRLQESFAIQRREARARIGKIVQKLAEGLGVETEMPSDEIAAIVLGLANGVAMEQIADPEQLDPDLLTKALQMLFRGTGISSSVKN